MKRHRKSTGRRGTVRRLWDYFWSVPTGCCPKCGSSELTWYDPFLFAPIRALKFRRRMQCAECRHVWRPQKNHISSEQQGEY